MGVIDGQRLQELREEKGLSQEDLGKILGISRNTVSGYERCASDPNLKTFLEICKYFDVSADYLLGLTDMEISYSRKNHFAMPSGLTSESIRMIKKYIVDTAELDRLRNKK